MREAMSTKRDYIVQKADVVGKQTKNPALQARALALFNRGENPTPENRAALRAATLAYKTKKQG